MKGVRNLKLTSYETCELGTGEDKVESINSSTVDVNESNNISPNYVPLVLLLVTSGF